MIQTVYPIDHLVSTSISEPYKVDEVPKLFVCLVYAVRKQLQVLKYAVTKRSAATLVDKYETSVQ